MDAAGTILLTLLGLGFLGGVSLTVFVMDVLQGDCNV